MWPITEFWGSNHITGAAEPKVVKFCTREGNINCMQQDNISPTKGRGYGHVTVLKFCRWSWCSATRRFVSDSWATCLSCATVRTDLHGKWSLMIAEQNGCRTMDLCYSGEFLMIVFVLYSICIFIINCYNSSYWLQMVVVMFAVLIVLLLCCIVNFYFVNIKLCAKT